jgi:hypothetical protein
MSIVLVGSTSGSCTLQEQAVAGTTVLTLPTVSGTIITTGSPQSGSVLQVVQASNFSGTNTTSTSFVTTNLTASITPKFSTSKILVTINTSVAQTTIGKNGVGTIYRNGSNIGPNDGFIFQENALSSGFVWCPASATYLDSPATTSSTSYTLYIKSSSGGTFYSVPSTIASTITLTEIAG